jgi:drug/metabolite transporter superfamily protein YnfA
MLYVIMIIQLVAFVIMGGISYFLWAKAKAQSALLMLVGFGAAAVCTLLMTFVASTAFPIIYAIGLLVAAGGFYMTFQSQIKAQLDALKSKVGGEE